MEPGWPQGRGGAWGWLLHAPMMSTTIQLQSLAPPLHTPFFARKAESDCEFPLGKQLKASVYLSRYAEPPGISYLEGTQHCIAGESKDEMPKNIGRMMQGSVVAFTGGLDILDLTTGFELCTLLIENLPSDIQDAELRSLFMEQDLEVDHFYLVGIEETGKGMLEAKLVTDKQSAEILVSTSGGLKLRGSTLKIEMSTAGVVGVMAPYGAMTLTVVWHPFTVKCSGKAPSREKVHLGGKSLGTEQVCPICYDSISNAFRLNCGHTYCSACLRHFLDSAVDINQFPLTCVADDGHCQVPVTISIIQQFLAPASFERLLEAAFNFYVSRRPTEFKFCRTPDCTQIYRSTSQDAAMKLRCPSCSKEVCSACGDEPHEGSTCDEFKRRKAEEEQTDAWVAAQGERVKKCPHCKVLIEKEGGCNRVDCRLVL